MGIMRTKSIEQSIRDTEEPEFQLRKALGPIDLIVFGIGVIIGTGIFVLTGVAAATYTGPAVSLSFVVAGIACALAALCYAEFASTVPVAGSAYTFSYASIGEFVAWIIGWDLILEFTVGAATVSVGWSGYFSQILSSFFGVSLPTAITSAEEGLMNLPAAIIALLLTVILVVGIRLSSGFNLVVTIIKLSVVVFFIGLGIFYVQADNLTPFIPPAAPPEGGGSFFEAPLLQSILGIEQTTFGFSGIITGAAVVFFAYIGFDVVATTAEEARNPRRDLPIGILGSLAICTILYILVSQIMTGIVPYTDLNDPAPMALAFSSIGLNVAAGAVSIGAICGLTSVIMILMLGQSRVAFAMSRDNLLPRYFARSHPRFRTPYRITILTGIVVAIMAAFFPLTSLANLVSIGTLFAFVLVAGGVMILRRTRPDLPRSFKTPLVPVVPILAILICLYLMLSLTGGTWIRFIVWMLLGVIIYFAYSVRASRLARGLSAEEAAREMR
ncbi:amino acid permease [Rubrobacter marinus]|uniref:Amino acid permease n=1 Tax=Rubrobacter marinus TaxID=2653852 RepID=A0A6G8Q230_9ACTN|nr:amino acid permease [Rubrobacter marinus]QIN80377.1 amino acid permease [Rubrobacter marinus]